MSARQGEINTKLGRYVHQQQPVTQRRHVARTIGVGVGARVKVHSTTPRAQVVDHGKIRQALGFFFFF